MCQSVLKMLYWSMYCTNVQNQLLIFFIFPKTRRKTSTISFPTTNYNYNYNDHHHHHHRCYYFFDYCYYQKIAHKAPLERPRSFLFCVIPLFVEARCVAAPYHAAHRPSVKGQWANDTCSAGEYRWTNSGSSSCSKKSKVTVFSDLKVSKHFNHPSWCKILSIRRHASKTGDNVQLMFVT